MDNYISNFMWVQLLIHEPTSSQWQFFCAGCNYLSMMTLSNGNIFRVTDPLWGESTSRRWIPLTKTSDVELWCFLWPAPEQTAEQTIDTAVILDAMALFMTSL